MLARHFPPIGGAGVHRSLGTVRYLPEHGYEVTVVTGPGAQVDRWSPQDPALLAELPAGTRIERTGPEPPGRGGWAARAERLLQRPAPWVSAWVRDAVETGLRAADGIDLVYASCIPYETALAGRRLAGELGVPWVADLEDPWALDEMRVHPTSAHRRRDRRRMIGALDGAAAVIMCADEAAVRMRAALPPAPGRRIESVPIGYEPAAFTGPRPARDGDTVRIVHTGSLHTELGEAHRRSAAWRRRLGGSSLDVDILTRSHVFLLEAVERAIAAQPELRERLRVHLAGGLTAGDRAVIGDRPFVVDEGQLSHGDTIALMRSADLLFLPMHELPPGRRAGLVPYKTYEYLAARRPILAAVPDGDVRDLLAPLAQASVVRPSDTAAMAEAIGAWAERAPAPDSPPPPELERRRSVERIAAVLDSVLAS
jgi:glycosyltransferase involved in cell wall biosynthesis